MVLKKILVVLLFSFAAVSWAQDRNRLAVFVPAPTGGTAAERNYFLEQFTMELKGANYPSVETKEASAYSLFLNISANEGFDSTSEPSESNRPWMLSIRLVNSKDDTEIVSFNFAYVDIDQMADWNLYLLYQAMANAYEPDDPAPADAPAAPETEKWLYLGLRGGSSLRLYTRDPADTSMSNYFIESQSIHFWNVDVAFQAAVTILPWLAFQAEAIWTTDYAPFTHHSYGNLSTTPFTSMSLMFPALVRFGLRKGPLMAGVLGGAYFFLPLGNMNNRAMGGDFAWSSTFPLGYTLGVNIGMKLGPGWLFLDLRWASDIGQTIRTDGTKAYQRNMLTLNFGYEIGLFTKKPKVKAAPSPETAPPEEAVPAPSN